MDIGVQSLVRSGRASGADTGAGGVADGEGERSGVGGDALRERSTAVQAAAVGAFAVVAVAVVALIILGSKPRTMGSTTTGPLSDAAGSGSVVSSLDTAAGTTAAGVQGDTSTTEPGSPTDPVDSTGVAVTTAPTTSPGPSVVGPTASTTTAPVVTNPPEVHSTPNPPPTSPPPTVVTTTGAPVTYAQTTGGATHTWTDYRSAGGTEGPTIAAFQTVQVACKVTGFRVADGNTWWYRIAQSPWNSAYYASADAFYNNGQTSGSLQGTPFVDAAVRDC